MPQPLGTGIVEDIPQTRFPHIPQDNLGHIIVGTGAYPAIPQNHLGVPREGARRELLTHRGLQIYISSPVVRPFDDDPVQSSGGEILEELPLVRFLKRPIGKLHDLHDGLWSISIQAPFQFQKAMDLVQGCLELGSNPDALICLGGISIEGEGDEV